MGGKAFPNYSVPRLPTDLWADISDRIQYLLENFYERFGVPMPQPGKKDHGDLDFVATGPGPGLQSTYGVHKETCALLGAVESTQTGPTTSFLVPLWPSDIAKVRNAGRDLRGEEHYCQVDIHMTSSWEQCEWVVCIHSYGDFFSLIGTMMKPFGLTYTDDGVYIRVAEMEEGGAGKRARIFVTGSPRRFWEEVLGFPFYRHFFYHCWTLPEMYAFVTKCRFFQFSSFIKDHALNSNARKRMRSRPAFREYIEEYLPRLKEEQPQFQERGKELTREMVWDEIMKRFDGVNEVAQERLEIWRAGISAQETRRKVTEYKKELAEEQQTYRDAWISWLAERERKT